LAGKAEAVASEARKRFQTTPVFGSEASMNSTHTDCKRIEELAEKATPLPWFANINQYHAEVRCAEKTPIANWTGFDDSNRPLKVHAINVELIVATANAAPDMAARLRRLNELLGEKLRRYISDLSRYPWEETGAMLTKAEARELLALLTGEEGEGK
jgi:hypothetical protein